jgi:hypothetical protein
MRSFADVIRLWPSAEQLADDLGIKGVTVRQWRNRNSIPAEHWLRLIEVGRARALSVTLDDLARLATNPLTAGAPTRYGDGVDDGAGGVSAAGPVDPIQTTPDQEAA